MREYFPAALETFDTLAHRDAVAVLGRAATPAGAATLSVAQIRAVLRRGGRQRNLDRRAREIQAGLRAEHLAAPEPVTAAFAAIVTAEVAIIRELNTQVDALEGVLGERFGQHPDADIYLSQPGLADVLGARVLGEFGDDPNRYANTKSRRNYAGTSPLTVASGTKRVVRARHIRNRRLADAIQQWALTATNSSPGCRAFYDERRAAGDRHNQALRALGNHLVSNLHGCLEHHCHYDEHTAWAHRYPNTAA